MRVLPLLFFLIGGVRLLAEDSYPIHEDAQDLRKLLGPDWAVTEGGDSIWIESVFKVYAVATMSRQVSPPDFADTISKAELEKEGAPRKYVITLKYGPMLAEAEYVARLKERRDTIDILRRGTKTKTAFGDAATKLLKLQVPRYHRITFVIYRTLPEGPGIQFYPPEAFRQIAAAKALIDFAEGHYPYEDL